MSCYRLFRKICIVVIVLLFGTGFASGAPPIAEKPTEAAASTKGLDAQTLGGWLKAEAKTTTGNWVASPLGLRAVLEILEQGASGATAKEIRTVLGLETTDRAGERSAWDLVMSQKNMTLQILGLEVEDGPEPKDPATTSGVVVKAVIPGRLGAALKIAVGDHIAQVGDTSVTSAAMLEEALRSRSGASVNLQWRRSSENDSALQQRTVILRELPRLSFATGVFVSDAHKLAPDFQTRVEQRLGAAVFPTDFRDPQSAGRLMEEWFGNRGIRPSPIPADALSPTTALVVANAVDLQGLWRSPFRADQTREGTFTTWGKSGSEPMTIPMMHMVQRLNYRETPDSQSVFLPLNSGGLGMAVILPVRDDEAGLQNAFVDWDCAALTQSETRSVDLALPKFGVSGSRSLKSSLRAAGLQLAFTTAADFRGMSESELMLDNVYQSATVRVNEQGLSAQAGTAAVMIPKSAPLPGSVTRLSIDRPFWLWIGDPHSRTTYFLARVVRPEAGK